MNRLNKYYITPDVFTLRKLNVIKSLYLDNILVRPLFRLPWKCEDGGCEHYGVVDLNILLITHRNSERMNATRLQTTQGIMLSHVSKFLGNRYNDRKKNLT